MDITYLITGMETWKDVVDYEGFYEVSNKGNVRRKSKALKSAVSPHGYKTLSLSKNGECKTKIVHRLVAEAFLENPENKSQVNHKDCNKENNELSNLEWNTNIENMTHAVANGRQRDQCGENNNMVKLIERDVLFIRELLDSKVTAYSIHRDYYPDLHLQTIYAIKQRRIWSHI